MTETHYVRPSSLAESLACLRDNPSMIVAGATDVYPARTNTRAWHGNTFQDHWLDISGVHELRGIREDNGSFRIGALVTWSELLASTMPPVFNGLKDAAREIGGVQIQNRATVVGNICNASPAADGVPCLLTLNAEVEVQSSDNLRVVPLSEFILGNRRTSLGHDEMVTAILIPKTAADSQSAFIKLGARKYLVISIVMVSGVMHVDDDGIVDDVRIAVGSCSPVARRLAGLESRLLGQSVASDLATLVESNQFDALSPISDVRSNAGYRHSVAIELVQRLLIQLAEKCR